jgi:MFS family permease
VVAIAAVHGLVHAFSIFLSPLNDEIRQYFLADSVATVTAFKSTYLATYAASNLVFGLLTNRISARRTLALGLALNGAAVAAFSLVPSTSPGWMHALWLIAAAGGGVYHPVANVLITRLYPTGKGRVLGFTGMGAAVGFALSPLVTTGLTAWLGLSWQQVALLFGLFGVIVAGWVYAIVRDVDAETPAFAPAARSSRTGLTAIAGVLIAVILISGTREMAMWSVLDISDFFLLRLLERTGFTGFYLFLLYAPGIIIQPLAGGLSDVVGRRWLATGSFVIYGASVAAAGLLPAQIVFLAYLGMGIGQAATIPTVEAFVADVAGPELRGVAYGAFFTAGIALGALGPGGTGALVDGLGGGLPAFRVVFLVLGGLVLLAAVFAPAVISGRGHAGNHAEPA